MPRVDAWGIERDATRYDGQLPIVAHPPCAAWGKLARFASGGDRHLALIAAEQIRRCGGVLEHPEGSGQRGYALSDDEVDMQQVTRVLRLLQARQDVEVDGDWLGVTVGGRFLWAFLAQEVA
jgi:hypothetical protein